MLAAIIALCTLLPRAWAMALGHQIGGLFFRINQKRVDIARVNLQWCFPELTEADREKLLRLPEELHKRVVGQDEAIDLVSDAVLRARSGINDPNRPLGSFIFLGPTGVGKTELARAFAEFLFDDEQNMIRIDMSEYMETDFLYFLF